MRPFFSTARGYCQGIVVSGQKNYRRALKKFLRHLIYFDANVSSGRIVKGILARSECDEKWWGRKPNYKQEEIECCGKVFNGREKSDE